MIDGLIAKRISPPGAQGPLEIELTVQDSIEATSSEAAFTLTVVLVIGPPDPNALAYLLPRSLFERGAPVHVGALAFDENLDTNVPDYADSDSSGQLVDPMLEILEVMAPGDMAVFLCQDAATLTQACLTLGLSPPAHGVG